MVTFGINIIPLGVLFKFLLIFFGVIYLLRMVFPFLFKFLITSWLKKSSQVKGKEPKKNYSKTEKSKPASGSIGEYIDYEEVE
jgi:hypothetical protein